MKALLKRMKAGRNNRRIESPVKPGAHTTSVCNYADNYYGDQVCLLAKDGGR